MTNTEGLTPKQQRAIQALLTERTITDAASKAGVSRRTLTVWLADEQFCAELSKTPTQAMDSTVRRLASLSGQAVDVLQTAMADEDTTTGAKLRAADIALGRLLSLRELHDFEQRLAALEAAQANGRIT